MKLTSPPYEMEPDPHPPALFYLIRHGETESNLGLRFQGQQDGELSALGREQAQALATYCDYLGEADCLCASDLGRAMDTAAFLATAYGLTAQTDTRLRERHFGAAEGLTWNEMIARFPEAPERWLDEHYSVPGGETRHEFQQRFLGFFEEKAATHPGEQVIIVTHGGVLNFFLRHTLGYGLDIPRAFAIRNTGVNTFSHSASQGWRLETWGDVTHLRHAKLLERSPG